MLRYRMQQVQPFNRGRWASSPSWYFQPTFGSISGSTLWKRTIQAWKLTLRDISVLEPRPTSGLVSTQTSLMFSPHWFSKAELSLKRGSMAASIMFSWYVFWMDILFRTGLAPCEIFPCICLNRQPSSLAL
jgi:hypothetical protein